VLGVVSAAPNDKDTPSPDGLNGRAERSAWPLVALFLEGYNLFGGDSVVRPWCVGHEESAWEWAILFLFDQLLDSTGGEFAVPCGF